MRRRPRSDRSLRLCYCNVMTRDEIIATIRTAAPALKAEGVTRLAIFGSRARGDARPDSDLDILVDATEHGEKPPFDLFKVMHLIEDAIGITTQISDRKLLKQRVVERIADDVVQGF